VNWPGKWSNVQTEIKSVTLSPTIAHAVTDSLSLGLGPRFVYFDFANRRDIGVPFVMQGDSWGLGATASLFWKATDTVKFGLVYRSEVKQELRGSAHSFLPSYTGRAKGTLHLPANTTGGINWQATEKLNLGVSATFTQWSSYDKLFVRINEVGMPDTKSWRNVWRFGVGGRYDLTDSVGLMAGYVYDMDPINAKHTDYMLPPGDRHILGLGASFAFAGNWEFSLGYSFIYMENRFRVVTAPTGASVPSKFKDSNANIFSTAIAYKF
ncbi:MAG: outer membrane protein transport protein, partial [Kiritimatiellaeota bacterium]|nr:outer membrane protein transport protein [Kiritimatiellota bacterium]